MPKLIYKFIRFEKAVLYAGWICYNKKSGVILGHVFYYPSWRKYVFSAKAGVVFDSTCLDDLKTFLDQLDGKKP